jgi:hypothetical protein
MVIGGAVLPVGASSSPATAPHMAPSRLQAWMAIFDSGPLNYSQLAAATGLHWSQIATLHDWALPVRLAVAAALAASLAAVLGLVLRAALWLARLRFPRTLVRRGPAQLE